MPNGEKKLSFEEIILVAQEAGVPTSELTICAAIAASESGRRPWRATPWWRSFLRNGVSRSKALGLACAAAAILVGGVGSSLSAGSGSAGVGGNEAAVTIQTFQFKPNRLEVKAGTQVTWTNQDEIVHTVTSGTPETRDGRFRSTLEGKGTNSSFTFTEPGIYPYFCERHQSMRGEIQVN